MNRRAFLCGSSAALCLSSLVGQGKSSDLNIEVQQEEIAELAPRFTVSLFNRTNTPVLLLLGTNVGGRNYASSIAFVLKDSDGHTKRLVLKEPAIAGAVSLFTVAIAPNERFQLHSIDLADYWSSQPIVQSTSVPPGRYSLSATFQGREPSAEFRSIQTSEKFWTGDLSSAPIEVTLHSAIQAKCGNAVSKRLPAWRARWGCRTVERRASYRHCREKPELLW